MEKKLKEMDENRKLQKEVIRKLQISIENLKEEKEELADEMNTKDIIIFNPKKKTFVKMDVTNTINRWMRLFWPQLNTEKQ